MGHNLLISLFFWYQNSPIFGDWQPFQGNSNIASPSFLEPFFFFLVLSWSLYVFCTSSQISNLYENLHCFYWRTIFGNQVLGNRYAHCNCSVLLLTLVTMFWNPCTNAYLDLFLYSAFYLPVYICLFIYLYLKHEFNSNPTL